MEAKINKIGTFFFGTISKSETTAELSSGDLRIRFTSEDKRHRTSHIQKKKPLFRKLFGREELLKVVNEAPTGDCPKTFQLNSGVHLKESSAISWKVSERAGCSNVRKRGF